MSQSTFSVFWNGRIIRGGRFTVSVDYRAYETRELEFVFCAFVITR